MKISKNMTKIILSAMMMFMILLILSNVVLADSVVDPINIKNTGNLTIRNMVRTVIGIAQVIAIGVAVIMLMVLAIKYMSAAPGDKAEIKKHAVVQVIDRKGFLSNTRKRYGNI